jgi:hypothetical protein
VINIQISHGDIDVILTDFGKVNITKSNKKGENNIHIVVPPKKEEKE